jgi:hypothetical protein
MLPSLANILPEMDLFKDENLISMNYEQGPEGWGEAYTSGRQFNMNVGLPLRTEQQIEDDKKKYQKFVGAWDENRESSRESYASIRFCGSACMECDVEKEPLKYRCNTCMKEYCERHYTLLHGSDGCHSLEILDPELGFIPYHQDVGSIHQLGDSIRIKQCDCLKEKIVSVIDIDVVLNMILPLCSCPFSSESDNDTAFMNLLFASGMFPNQPTIGKTTHVFTIRLLKLFRSFNLNAACSASAFLMSIQLFQANGNLFNRTLDIFRSSNVSTAFNNTFQEYRSFEQFAHDPPTMFDVCHACPYKSEEGRKVFMIDGNFRLHRFKRASHYGSDPKLSDSMRIGNYNFILS